MNNDNYEHILSPSAEAIALKLQAYLKSKEGKLLQQVKLNHNSDRYYWCIMHKQFILVNGGSQMYILPWKKDDKGQVYVYSHYFFAQGAVFLVPEEEIVYMGFN